MTASTQPVVRTAEVIASMCLATDLGMGFPFEHGLQGTLLTMRLCDVLDVDDDVRSSTYYASLLMYAGCTVDEVERSALFAGDMTQHHTHRQFGTQLESMVGVSRALQTPGAPLPKRAREVVVGLPRAAMFIQGHFAALCEVAGMLAQRLGVPQRVYEMFPLLTERWDGKSVLDRASGDEIPLPIRLIQVGRDAAYQSLIGDSKYVRKVIRSRAGKAFDPDVADALLSNPDVLEGGPHTTAWDEVLVAEPKPWLDLEGEDVRRALAAIGSFADMVSPHLAGHCSGVADLAAKAASIHGFPTEEIEAVRLAGYVHDVGRTAISSRIWNKPGPLTADEREQARLHPYHTDRVLARSPFLAGIASVASAHHERLDGSGYHRGLDRSSLEPGARLLAVADAFQSKIESRPYRQAFSPEEATEILGAKSKSGAFDPDMVRAVAEAAGESAPDLERPAGLTDREAEVVGLLARGLSTKQIGRALGISPKTADRHIQNSYRKMDVSSRAAATLFATEHGLLRR